MARAGLGFKFNRRSLVGVAVYAGLASLFSYFLRDDQIRSAIPWLFLLPVIPVTHLCGRLAALLGTTLSTVIFAVFLFPPFGSPVVQDATDLITLVSFQIGAIVVAFLCSPTSSMGKQAKSRL